MLVSRPQMTIRVNWIFREKKNVEQKEMKYISIGEMYRWKLLLYEVPLLARPTIVWPLN